MERERILSADQGRDDPHTEDEDLSRMGEWMEMVSASTHVTALLGQHAPEDAHHVLARAYCCAIYGLLSFARHDPATVATGTDKSLLFGRFSRESNVVLNVLSACE
jgi:hypothetical protein